MDRSEPLILASEDEKIIMACGLYRSGTTFLQEILRLNLINVVNPHRKPFKDEPPYKHVQYAGDLHLFYPGIHIIMTYKNPYKWIDSICRKSLDLVETYHITYEKGETPVTTWYEPELVLARTKPIQVTVGLEQLIKHYNRWMAFWREEYINWPFVAMSYHDWAFDPRIIVDKVSKTFNIAKSSTFVVPKQKDISNSQDFTLDKFKQRYMNDDYYDLLTPEHLDIIKNNINWDNYEWLTSIK